MVEEVSRLLSVYIRRLSTVAKVQLVAGLAKGSCATLT